MAKKRTAAKKRAAKKKPLRLDLRIGTNDVDIFDQVKRMMEKPTYAGAVTAAMYRLITLQKDYDDVLERLRICEASDRKGWNAIAMIKRGMIDLGLYEAKKGEKLDLKRDPMMTEWEHDDDFR